MMLRSNQTLLLVLVIYKTTRIIMFNEIVTIQCSTHAHTQYTHKKEKKKKRKEIKERKKKEKRKHIHCTLS